MINLDITDDNKFLIVQSCEKTELAQLRLSLTKELPNAYIIKKTSVLL